MNELRERRSVTSDIISHPRADPRIWVIMLIEVAHRPSLGKTRNCSVRSADLEQTKQFSMVLHKQHEKIRRVESIRTTT